MINKIKSVFKNSKNNETAIGMSAYMKDHFQFLGIKSPIRKELQKQFSEEIKQLTHRETWKLILKLWELPEREFQYFAMDIIKRKYKKPEETDLKNIKYLIVTKSWWDTVDFIASHTLGLYLMSFPEKREEISHTFIVSNNLWLQRSTLLFQLKYKEQVDSSILYQNILTLNNNRDFFIQKAIGWSLRQFSKSNPIAVQLFLKNHQEINKLALREASKYLENK